MDIFDMIKFGNKGAVETLIVKNPNGDDGTDFWNTEGQCSLSVVTPTFGTQGFEFITTGIDSNNKYGYQDIIVEAGIIYDITLEMGREGADAGAGQYYCKVVDQANEAIEFISFSSAVKGAWQLFSGSFNTGAYTTLRLIYYYSSINLSISGRKMLFRNAVITKQ